MSAPISVLLPTPGGPVKPMMRAAAGLRIDLPHQLPAGRVVVLDEADARASARLSPASRRSARDAWASFGSVLGLHGGL